MIGRHLASILQDRLAQFPAVALLGPRQVGKTTLARSVAEESAERAEYLDLENPADLAKLDDPVGYLRSRTNRLVILDEVQRSPGLFQVLRGVIDERIRHGEETGQFLLLGSASMDLLRQSSESLAGRISYLELGPFDVLEVGQEKQAQLWVRGGFPRSFLAKSDEASATWRADFITTYLERDIPQLGPRIPTETLRRFWTMLAHRQGTPLNASEIARSLGVDSKTVATYLDLMVALLLVRRLPPLHANVEKRLVKSPKTYVRDSGLVHSLLRLDTHEDLLGHPILGASWEGFVIETLIRSAPPRTQASYYRTAGGAEMDLVLDLPGAKRWAIEVKYGLAPKLGRGFHSALEDLGADRCFVVYSGEQEYGKGDGVEVVGLGQMRGELRRPVSGKQ